MHNVSSAKTAVIARFVVGDRESVTALHDNGIKGSRSSMVRRSIAQKSRLVTSFSL